MPGGLVSLPGIFLDLPPNMKRLAILMPALSLPTIVKRTIRSRVMSITGAAIAFVMAGQVTAEPGDSTSTSGNSEATVIEPIGLQNITDLRFGRTIQPETGGTFRVRTNGSVAENGGVVGNAISTPQVTNGRGPGALAVFGDPFRLFVTFLPQQTTVTNGTAAMLVDDLNWNPVVFTGPFSGLTYGRFDADGYSAILVGGRLNVAADQEVGTYSGTYPVTVLYL